MPKINLVFEGGDAIKHPELMMQNNYFQAYLEWYCDISKVYYTITSDITINLYDDRDGYKYSIPSFDFYEFSSPFPNKTEGYLNVSDKNGITHKLKLSGVLITPTTVNSVSTQYSNVSINNNTIPMLVMTSGEPGRSLKYLNIFVDDDTLPVTRLEIINKCDYVVPRFSIKIYKDRNPDLLNKQLVLSDSVTGKTEKTYVLNS